MEQLIGSLKRDEIRLLCKKYGLAVSGLKADLVSRVCKHLEQNRMSFPDVLPEISHFPKKSRCKIFKMIKQRFAFTRLKSPDNEVNSTSENGITPIDSEYHIPTHSTSSMYENQTSHTISPAKTRRLPSNKPLKNKVEKNKNKFRWKTLLPYFYQGIHFIPSLFGLIGGMYTMYEVISMLTGAAKWEVTVQQRPWF